MDLGIASYAIRIPFVEPHHRSGLSQNLVARVWVLEKLVGKWVNIHLRDRRRSAGCVGLPWCFDISGGAKCCHVSLRVSRLPSRHTVKRNAVASGPCHFFMRGQFPSVSEPSSLRQYVFPILHSEQNARSVVHTV